MMIRRLLMTSFALSAIGLGAIPSVSSQEKAASKPLSDDVKELVRGNNEFALDLYAQLSKKEGNIVFSPYSISSAMAMTYAGARGKTAEEIAKTMHFTLPPERLHAAFGEVIGDLQKDEKDRPFHLYVANSFWGQKGFPFAEGFVQLAQKQYRAGINQVNFAGDPEGSRRSINGWVEEQTKGKIKDLLGKEDVDSATRLVLANALSFKGSWKLPFPQRETKNDLFELSPSRKVSVPMMTITKQVFKYVGGKDLQWLELPYKGDRLAMVVILPRKKDGLAELEEQITEKVLLDGIAKLDSRDDEGQVVLPRFKFTTDCPIVENVKMMGMVLPFSPDADFSGISSEKNLSISTIVHQAKIEIDEIGTEGVASTAVTLSTRSGGFFFRADHPFLFFIRDRQSNNILFLGRVTDPQP